MKYNIKIYGCQYNEWDGARLKYLLDSFGFIETSEKEAELIFVLSCSVRKSAVDRAMGKVHNFREEGKKVIVCGCVLEHDRQIYLNNDALLWDSNNLTKLKSILNLKEEIDQNKYNSGNATSNYLPIMTGCNNFCSYCAVPYTRGREKSRPVEEIAADFEKMVKRGAKEITLLGQNVNSFTNTRSLHFGRDDNGDGRDDNGDGRGDKKNDFAQLLEILNNIPGDFLICFTSNHPKDMNDEIIAAIRDLEKVKKEIHLPLQSGSNRILKLMNRPYTIEQYLALVEKIKKEILGVVLTTDTIVGFPGETEEDFQETVSVLKKVNFYQAFNNKYSPRSGTKAFELGDPVPWEEKDRRWRILNAIVNAKH